MGPTGMCSSIFVRSVVLPVPAFPVRTTKPLRARMAYVSPANASRCCAVRYRNSGSGVKLNGALCNPKKSLYIVLQPMEQELQAGGAGPARQKQGCDGDTGEPFP